MRNNFRVVERLALLAVICPRSAVPATLLAHVTLGTFLWRGATRSVRSSADHRCSVRSWPDAVDDLLLYSLCLLLGHHSFVAGYGMQLLQQGLHQSVSNLVDILDDVLRGGGFGYPGEVLLDL